MIFIKRQDITYSISTENNPKTQEKFINFKNYKFYLNNMENFYKLNSNFSVFNDEN